MNRVLNSLNSSKIAILLSVLAIVVIIFIDSYLFHALVIFSSSFIWWVSFYNLNNAELSFLSCIDDDNKVSSVMLPEVIDNINRINSVIKDATEKLNSSFTNMLKKNDSQSILSSNIMLELSSDDDDNKKSNLNLKEFVCKTNAILNNYVSLLVTISDKSIGATYKMQDMVQQMDGMLNLLEDINGLPEQTNRSRETNSQIRKQIEVTKECLNDANNFVGDIASINMNSTLEAKAHLDEVLIDIKNLNKLLSVSITKSSEISTDLKSNVNQAVMALQYKDLVTQLSHVSENLLSKEFEKKRTVMDYANNNSNVVGIKEIIFKLNIDITKNSDNKQVVQDDMAEGEIELF